MYSPESEELKRKITRIVTVVFVALLLSFPIYMLVFKDSNGGSRPLILDTDVPPIERAQPDAVTPEPTDRITEREVIEPPREQRTPPRVAERPRPEPERDQTPPRRTPVPAISGSDAIDFPGTPQNQRTTRQYTLRNTGDHPLQVSRISVTGDDAGNFTVSGTDGFTLQPNATRNIEVEFVPSTGGSKTAVMRIESNDPRRNPFQIALRGEGVTEKAGETVLTTLFEEGQQFFDSRRFRYAEETYTNILSLDPYYGPAYLMRGRSRYEQGEYLAAVSDFDEALKYRLSIPRDQREQIECVTLYYAALSITEQALRTEDTLERDRFLRPALGRWEDFRGVCTHDATLLENAEYWVQRLRQQL
jgi:hypothetical protein